MSTSLHSKKKEALKIEPPQINNECIDSLIGRNLIDVRELVGRIETNDAAACAIREETRGEATSTSSKPKMKKEDCKIKNPKINNEGMEKMLVQLVRAVI